eukprot:TCONS_00069695-protein
MTNKKHEKCPLCKNIQTLKSGWAFKSPPQDQLKKKRFRRRWLTLSIVEVCNRHWMDDLAGFTTGSASAGGVSGSSDKQFLVLSYFKDDTENSLKGQFYLHQQGAVKNVQQISEDCPSKYKESPFILRWELALHENRILYMILENENEMKLWLKAFENYFQMKDQTADKVDDDDLVEKKVQKFQPDLNNKIQREIAASKKNRNYQPSFTEHDIPLDEPDHAPSSPTTRRQTPPDPISTKKRSGGSFIRNEERDSFEDETPSGYNYLPPINHISIKQKTTRRSSEDKTDQSPNSSYTYMPPPKNTPKTPEGADEGNENYSFLPSPKKIHQFKKLDFTDGKIDEENYNFMPAPKNTPAKSSPEGGNENYTFLPPPTPASPGLSIRDKLAADKLNRVQNTAVISSDNYDIVPQPKPITPINNMTNLWGNSGNPQQERQNSQEENGDYSFLPPPKPSTPKSPQPSNGYDYLPPQEQSDTGYDFLPAPATVKPKSPSIMQPSYGNLTFPNKLENEKHTPTNNRYGFDCSDNSNAQDESYINFQPLQQMKMIAKNNMKKPVFDGSKKLTAGGGVSAGNDGKSYVNFKY